MRPEGALFWNYEFSDVAGCFAGCRGFISTPCIDGFFGMARPWLHPCRRMICSPRVGPNTRQSERKPEGRPWAWGLLDDGHWAGKTRTPAGLTRWLAARSHVAEARRLMPARGNCHPGGPPTRASLDQSPVPRPHRVLVLSAAYCQRCVTCSSSLPYACSLDPQLLLLSSSMKFRMRPDRFKHLPVPLCDRRRVHMMPAMDAGGPTAPRSTTHTSVTKSAAAKDPRSVQL